MKGELLEIETWLHISDSIVIESDSEPRGELLEIKTLLKVIQSQKGNQSLFKLSLEVIQAIFRYNGS